MFLIAGLINITNIYYFATEYSGESSRGWALTGSAVCTQTYWAVCEDCTPEHFPGDEGSRAGQSLNGTIMALRNDCEVGIGQAAANWVTWVFFFLSLSAMSLYLHAREIRSDEDKVTARDYSVLVKNPPPDALDPDEWRDHFSQFAEKQVTVVSLHLNNEVLLKQLVRRRLNRDNLRRMLPKGTEMEDENELRIAVDIHVRERDAEPKGCVRMMLECLFFRPLRLFGMFVSAEMLLDRIDKLTEKIKKLQEGEYELSKVFITFETEEGQRAALTAHSASLVDIIRNNTDSAPPNAVFHGRVLRVVPPTEPNAVRWRDLSTSKIYRMTARVLTFMATLGLTALAVYLEDLTRRRLGPSLSGPLV
jgi:Cytosolic domain of 10TM putative phosphate transporter